MKTISTFLLCVISIIGYAQIDSTNISNAVNLGVGILNTTHGEVIHGVDNGYLGGLIVTIILGIVRIFEKRNLINNLKK